MKNGSSVKRFAQTRVVRNSGWAYLQLATGGLTGFLSATLALKALGVSAYGTYASVAAFVSAGGMLNVAVQRTATRFLGVELGKDPSLRQMAETFSSSLSLAALVVLALMALGETGGLWFLETCLRYPPEFAASARMAFQGLLLAIAFRLLTLPFVCRIIAAERLSALAVAALGTGCLRLMAAASLFVLPDLGLGGYAVLSLTPGLFNRLAREAGAYVATSASGLQVNMNGDFISVHCLRPGRHEFALPFHCQVVNLKTGAAESVSGKCLTLNLTAGETCRFRLKSLKGVAQE